MTELEPSIYSRWLSHSDTFGAVLNSSLPMVCDSSPDGSSSQPGLTHKLHSIEIQIVLSFLPVFQLSLVSATCKTIRREFYLRSSLIWQRFRDPTFEWDWSGDDKTDEEGISHLIRTPVNKFHPPPWTSFKILKSYIPVIFEINQATDAIPGPRSLGYEVVVSYCRPSSQSIFESNKLRPNEAIDVLSHLDFTHFTSFTLGGAWLQGVVLEKFFQAAQSICQLTLNLNVLKGQRYNPNGSSSVEQSISWNPRLKLQLHSSESRPDYLSSRAFLSATRLTHITLQSLFEFDPHFLTGLKSLPRTLLKFDLPTRPETILLYGSDNTSDEDEEELQLAMAPHDFFHSFHLLPNLLDLAHLHTLNIADLDANLIDTSELLRFFLGLNSLTHLKSWSAPFEPLVRGLIDVKGSGGLPELKQIDWGIYVANSNGRKVFPYQLLKTALTEFPDVIWLLSLRDQSQSARMDVEQEFRAYSMVQFQDNLRTDEH